MNVKTRIFTLWHEIKMICSSRYATNHQVVMTLLALWEETIRCHHATANIELIRSLVQTVQNLDQNRLGEAIEILVKANNFDCKAYAIELNPEAGKTCADQLMETARHNLWRYGHGDHATWARKKLILSRKWYRIAGALTQDLAEEINAGLEKTKWVLNMWPNHADIVDPEGH